MILQNFQAKFFILPMGSRISAINISLNHYGNIFRCRSLLSCLIQITYPIFHFTFATLHLPAFDRRTKMPLRPEDTKVHEEIK